MHADEWDTRGPVKNEVDVVLTEGNYDKHLLQMHLHHCFANQRGAEESAEWDEKMTTCNTSQVEQRVRYLKPSNEQTEMLSQSHSAPYKLK